MCSWRGDGDGGKRRSHVPVIHYHSARAASLAVERRTLRDADAAFARSRSCSRIVRSRPPSYTYTFDVDVCVDFVHASSYESVSVPDGERRYARKRRERESERGTARECAAENASAFSPQCQGRLTTDFIVPTFLRRPGPRIANL